MFYFDSGGVSFKLPHYILRLLFLLTPFWKIRRTPYAQHDVNETQQLTL
jgi:hypothetical protein